MSIVKRCNLDVNYELRKVNELQLNPILEFLVREEVSLDKGKAKEVIKKLIGTDPLIENKFSY